MIPKVKTFFRNLRFSENSIPLALLAANILAFGLLIPFLGYYQDDWHFVYYAYTRGAAGLWELFNFDGHPLEAWFYILGFWALGYKPIYWHLLSLLFRWLTCLAVWLCLREVWPARVKETFTAALLFAIYPFFSLQPQAISYVGVWFSYFLTCLSFYWMLKAIRTPQKFGRYLALSFAVKVIQLTTSDYLAGLELVRPVLIWLTLPAEKEENIRGRIWKTAKIWAPYFLAAGAFTAWRVFLYKTPLATHNEPALINKMEVDPLGTIQYLILTSLPDFVLILFTSWSGLFTPRFFQFSQRTDLALFILIVIGFLAALLFTNRLKEQEDRDKGPDWIGQGLWLGLIAMILGMLPAYAGDYFINLENPPWNSRFSLASTFGAALVITAFLYSVVPSAAKRAVITSILVGLSLGWHTDNTNVFRLVWLKQARFYEELVWRAPSIEPDTAVISDREFLVYMGDYPMAFAINSVYAKRGVASGREVPYWYYAISSDLSDRLESFLEGMTLKTRKFSVKFEGDGTKNIILTFEPEKGQCLQVIRPQDQDAPYISPLLQAASRLSAPERISAASANPLLDEILGRDWPKTWCYYFEKADLARQQEDWETVARLWETASQGGLQPGNNIEYLPFIEAFTRLGNWRMADSLTRAALTGQKGMRPSLCYLWENLEEELPASTERDQTIGQVRSYLNCSW